MTKDKSSLARGRPVGLHKATANYYLTVATLRIFGHCIYLLSTVNDNCDEDSDFYLKSQGKIENFLGQTQISWPTKDSSTGWPGGTGFPLLENAGTLLVCAWLNDAFSLEKKILVMIIFAVQLAACFERGQQI